MAGTGAGKGRQIIFPGDRVGEKRPGTSGNGFPGFPVASLFPTNNNNAFDGCLAPSVGF